MRRLPMVGALLAFAALLCAQTWPHPDDIPKPKPVAVGLAGAAEPDITRFLLAQGPQAPRLSPDGKRLLFVSSVTGKPQLWVVDTAGGAPQQLTFGLGVSDGEWTPDGQRIVYAADRGGNERFGFYAVTPDGTRETELVAQSPAFTAFGDFIDGGRGFAYATAARDGRSFDTWAAPVAGGPARELLRGRMGLYPALANRSGDLVAMVESRGEDGRDLSLLDVKTGGERLLRKPAEAALNAPVAWTPDGHLYIVTNEGRSFAALALLDIGTGQSRIVEAPAHDVAGADLSSDGRFLAWQTDEGGFYKVHVRDLRTARMLPAPALPLGVTWSTHVPLHRRMLPAPALPLGVTRNAEVDAWLQMLPAPALPLGVTDIRFARDAPVLAIHVAGPTTPGETWVWNCATGPSAAGDRAQPARERRSRISTTSACARTRSAICSMRSFGSRDSRRSTGAVLRSAGRPMAGI